MNEQSGTAAPIKQGIESFAAIPEMRVDPAWYRATNPAVRHALLERPDTDLNRQFLEAGQFEGANPNPLFLLSHYLKESKYAERNSGLPPCEDYLRHSGRLKASAHWLFDEAWVQQQQPKLADSIGKGNWISAYVHSLRGSPGSAYAPHPMFNIAYYRRVAGIGPEVDAYRHFLNDGQYRGLSPHPLFDPAFYALVSEQTFGRGQEFQSPLHHFLVRGRQLGLPPIADFDTDYYLARYPEVAEALAKQKTTAFDHFLRHGQFEGRSPNGNFNPADYAWYNPRIGDEMKALGLASPFEHFMAVGAAAGLRASRPKFRMPPVADTAKGIFEQRARIAAQLYCHEGLALATSDKPAVSLIIPVLNNFTFTMSLLGQIREAIAASPHILVEVIVVDNGSHDTTLDLLRYVKGIELIRREERLGYLGACRLGAAQARGDILVFLNNDIELTPGLLDRMPGAFADPQVAISGPRIVGAGGLLQEAGCAVLRDGHGYGFGRGKDPTDPIYLQAREVDYVSGCFLCVRRSVYEELGGFDESYQPGYYEDTDLCVRARAKGYRVVYDPSLVIYHYEYATFSDGRPPRISEVLMRGNHVKFVARNAAELARRNGRMDVEGDDIAFVQVVAARPKRILFIEDRVPAPERGSGFTASADILTDMREAGFDVTVWALHERAEMAFPLWEKGTQTLLPAIGGETSVAEHLARAGKAYDIVWVGRTHNFRALRRPLIVWRNGARPRRLIVDTEALVAPRDAALAARIGEPWTDAQVLEGVRAEIPQFEAVDRVITKNHLDAAYLARASGLTATVLGHRFTPRSETPGPENRRDILFVGAIYGQDTPNYDSLRWFIQDVLPLIDAGAPGIRFHVAGYQERSVPAIDSSLAAQIVWHGEVADLAPLFDAARVFVAPTRYAGGLPHKVQNALANGIPVVLTPLLWQQLDDDPDKPAALAPADWSPAAFADCVLRLLRDDTLWLTQQALGLDYVRKACSPETHRTTILGLING